MKTGRRKSKLSAEQQKEMQEFRRLDRINFDARQFYDEMVAGACRADRCLKPGEAEGFTEVAQKLAEVKEKMLPEPERPKFLKRRCC